MIAESIFNSLYFLGKNPAVYIDGNYKKKNYILYFLSILSYIVIFMTIFYLFHLYFTIKNKPYVTKTERFLFENDRNPSSYKFMFGLRNKKNEIVDFNRQELNISFKSVNQVKIVSCDSEKFRIRSIYDKDKLSLSSVCFEFDNFISSDTIMIKFKENYFTTKEYLINKYKDLELLWFYEMEVIDENKIDNSERIMHLIKVFKFEELFNVFESQDLKANVQSNINTSNSNINTNTTVISTSNTTNTTSKNTTQRSLQSNNLFVFSNTIKYELEFTRKEVVNDIGFLWEINQISNSLDITSNYYYLKNVNPFTMNLAEYISSKNITSITGLRPTNYLTDERSDFNVINTVNIYANGNKNELDLFYKPIIEIEISISNLKRTVKRSPKSFADFFAQISGVYFVIMFIAWLISHWYKEVDYYYNMIIQNFKVEAFEQIYQDYEIKDFMKEINLKTKGNEIKKLNFDNYKEDDDWVLTFKCYYDKQVRRNTNVDTESDYNSLPVSKHKKNINLKPQETVNNNEYSNMQNSTQRNLNSKFNLLNNENSENLVSDSIYNNEFNNDFGNERKYNTNIPNKIIFEDVNELNSTRRNKNDNTIKHCDPDKQNSFSIDSRAEDILKNKKFNSIKNREGSKLENIYNSSFHETKKSCMEKDFENSYENTKNNKNNAHSNYKLGIKKNNLLDDFNDSVEKEEDNDKDNMSEGEISQNDNNSQKSSENDDDQEQSNGLNNNNNNDAKEDDNLVTNNLKKMITKTESINIHELKDYVDEKFVLDFNLIDYFNVYFLCGVDKRFNRKYKYFDKAKEFIQNSLDINNILKKSYKLEQLMKIIFSSNQLRLLNKYFDKISIIDEIDEKTRGFLMDGAEDPGFHLISGKRNKDFIEKKILDYYCINTYSNI